LTKLRLIKEFTVLNNVVKSTSFYPAKERTGDISNNRFLHISTFDDEHKNISGMLSAFSRLKTDFYLHIVTEGEELDVWKAIENHNIPKGQCIVQSKLNTVQIGQAMRQADCLVLFSNYETFSVVLAEAWMSGLPAIYSQCGGLTEINNPDLGMQIKLRDESGLLNALESFTINDYNPELICDFANQFSEEGIKRQLEEVYRSF